MHRKKSGYIALTEDNSTDVVLLRDGPHLASNDSHRGGMRFAEMIVHIIAVAFRVIFLDAIQVTQSRFLVEGAFESGEHVEGFHADLPGPSLLPVLFSLLKKLVVGGARWLVVDCQAANGHRVVRTSILVRRIEEASLKYRSFLLQQRQLAAHLDGRRFRCHTQIRGIRIGSSSRFACPDVRSILRETKLATFRPARQRVRKRRTALHVGTRDFVLLLLLRMLRGVCASEEFERKFAIVVDKTIIVCFSSDFK